MSIEREFEGKTVTDATIEACKELGITRDELNFEVIREGSSGVLGIGSRNAIIKVRDVESGNNDIQKNELDAVPMDTEKIEKIFRHIVDHFVEESEIEVEVQNRNILLKMKSSADLGFLIGKKGDMIKNLEFLLIKIAKSFVICPSSTVLMQIFSKVLEKLIKSSLLSNLPLCAKPFVQANIEAIGFVEVSLPS